MTGPAVWAAVRTTPVTGTTVADVLPDAAAAAPDTVALVEGVADPARRRRWTYGELCDEADALARGLAACFEPGERLAVWGPSRPESLLVTYAAAMAGLVLVPVNPALRPAELAQLLGHAGAAGLVRADQHRGRALAEVLAPVRGQLPGLRRVLAMDQLGELAAPGRPRPAPPGPDDVAQLVYTSGTTGAPKGARLTHRAMANAARFGGERFGVRPGDVYVMTMPLCHVGGQVVSLQIGQARATNVLVPAFDAGLQLELIESCGATLTAGVPTMLLDLIDHPDFARRDLSSLRSVSSGGAVVPEALVRHIEAALGVRFTICFGQTETCGFISQTHLDDDAADKAETLGRPLPHVEARVVGADGEPVAFGAVGELEVRGYHVMAGYHDDPAATAEALRPDGWLRTGDLVTMDDRGYLRMVGRTTDMIVTGGVNVYPAEIEAVLSAHPAVARVAVVGVPDRRWGEAVTAAVVPADAAGLDPDELADYCRERLAPFKVPKRVVAVDALPLTVSGKVRKFVLREQLS